MANPTGKGGFQERPQDINLEGAPRRGQTWRESVKRITDMTREEAINFVGRRSKLAKLLRELPPELPIKDALVFISIIQYGRDPNPRLLATLMDREEGKPEQPIVGGDAPVKVIIEYANNQDPASETPHSPTEDQERAEEI